MDDYVATPDMRILHVLARLCARFEQLYCYPSHQTIRELAFRFTGRSISARSLCRHLGALERDGWITRRRRHERGRDGNLVLHSTLYVLRKRAIKFARATISSVWNWSTGAAKRLMDIAVPFLAETLAQGDQIYTQRRQKPPPKR